MTISFLVVGLFILFILLSIFFSTKAYNAGVKVKKVLLVQVLSFIFSLFTCSAVAVTATSEKSAEVQAKLVSNSAEQNGGSSNITAANSDADVQSKSSVSNDSKGLGFLAMAIVMGLACLGAGIAVAAAAPAAIGAVLEDKKSFGTSLVFVALAEGVTVFGLLIAIFIYNGLNAS